MIRSHNTKAGSFSCAGEKFSTLAEAVAFVESPEGRNWEKWLWALDSANASDWVKASGA
jgi:nitrous oxide reductase accessory protein NosL